ncbi:hypothetical protein C5167_019289 [Papaver somniferum]|uniref:Glycoside hydrolase family 38 N-terminal domain-containing protein n=1 Tax=Papaver somniferum TaxID=3469 RepID=A0A4Y7ITV4_PAPSO|nr:hypothetical protein C5167_019289 [Papaver somniferum]
MLREKLQRLQDGSYVVEVVKEAEEPKVGFDSFFFGRIDYQDLQQRKNEKRLEFVWQGSKTLGSSAQIFAGALTRNYEPPSSNFYFEVNDASPIVQVDCFSALRMSVPAIVSSAVSPSKDFIHFSLLFILNSISSRSSLFIMYSSSSSSLFVMNSISSSSSLFIMYSSSSSLFVMNSISFSSSIITITLINSKGSQKRCKGPSYNEFFITMEYMRTYESPEVYE